MSKQAKDIQAGTRSPAGGADSAGTVVGEKRGSKRAAKPAGKPAGKSAQKPARESAQKSAAKPAQKSTDKPAAGKKTAKDRIEVRQSGVHGKGVYAIAPIAAGERVIEYKGEHISWKEALDRHPHDPQDPNHTFYFSLDDGNVIDAKYGGNRARWINHACEPNCEAEEKKGRVFIHALRDIAAGEELFYDYGLVIDAPYTKKLKQEYACRCGSPDCRGTMLAPKGKKKKK